MVTIAEPVEGRVFANITKERIVAKIVEAIIFANMAYVNMFAFHVTVEASAATARRRITAWSVIHINAKW